MTRESEFSRLHPLVNFIYLAGVILITMLTINPVMLLISFAASFAYGIMLCGGGAFRRNLIIFIPIIIFTVIIQPLFSHSGMTALFYINDSAVTLESVVYGVAVSVLLMSTIQWFTCYNALVTPDRFLYIFGKIIPSLAMVISMVFRLVPLLRHRFAEIDEGQAGMGMKSKEMGITGRARVFIKEISILIAWSLEASIDTSDSMESRGYGLKGRTSFHLFRLQIRDCAWIVLILCITGACIFGIVEKGVQIYYFPVLEMKEMSGISFITFAGFAALAAGPIIYDLGGMLKWRQLNSKM